MHGFETECSPLADRPLIGVMLGDWRRQGGCEAQKQALVLYGVRHPDLHGDSCHNFFFFFFFLEAVPHSVHAIVVQRLYYKLDQNRMHCP